jgi:uroporphyrinogen decarboxylase
MLIAMQNGQPDRVPCAPDISIMVPARLTGKPFWEIEYYDNPPRWKAYNDAAKHFGIDLWSIWGYVNPHCDSKVTTTHRIVRQTSERMVVRYRHATPAGDLESETTFFVADSAWPTEKPIKDIERDFACLRYFYPELTGYDVCEFEEMRADVGDTGVAAIMVGYPGFQAWEGRVEGGVETLTYALYDRPDLIEEWHEMAHRRALRLMEFALDAKPDFVLIGGSGTITLQGPDLARRFSLPSIKAMTRLAKEAGIPSMLHSCGKERALVEMCAEETELDCINPVEPPPQGDCDLAELKQTFGDRMAFMGNLHTTDVMLRGTVEHVRRAAMKAIDDAGANGGFILSTADQCGRDTPDENLRALVEVCQTYGVYR